MIICDLLLKGYKIKPHLSGVKRWMWTWALFESWFSDNCGMYVCYRKNTEIDNEVIRNTYKHRSWAAEMKKWLIAYWSFRRPSSVPSTCVGKFKICCNSSSMGSDKWTLQVFGGTPLRQTHTPCNEISTHTPQGGCIVQWWGNCRHMTPDLICSSTGKRRNNCTYSHLDIEWMTSYLCNA